MDLIKNYWEPILFLGLLIYHASRTQSIISELKKDVDQLSAMVERGQGWAQKQQEQLVQLRAETDVNNKQITSLWDFVNGLRERINGKH